MSKIYDDIISFGTQCNVGISLRQMNLKGETYPFDWVCSNSKIIYDVLVNGPDKYVTFDGEKSNDYYVFDLDFRLRPKFPFDRINSYGQLFTHYMHMSAEKLAEKLSRRMRRLFDLLQSNKKVLFIQCHEEYIYHKKSRDDKDILYDYLCKINDHICEKYPQLDFTILNIEIDNKYQNYGKIINVSMEYLCKFSDGETNVPSYFEPYRREVTKVIKKFLE